MTEWIPGPKRPEDEPEPKAPEPTGRTRWTCRRTCRSRRPDACRSGCSTRRRAARASRCRSAPGRATRSARRRPRRDGAAGGGPSTAVTVVSALVVGVPSGRSSRRTRGPRGLRRAMCRPAPHPTRRSSPRGASSNDYPPEGVGETPRPASLPEADLRKSAAKGYVFATLQKDKKTGITWSPCRPITWVVRAAGRAPKDGDRMLRESFARLAQLTGLEFDVRGHDEGEVLRRPRAVPAEALRPALGAGARQLVEHEGRPGPEGRRARPRRRPPGSTPTAATARYISGTVEPRRRRARPACGRSPGTTSPAAVVMHELGHLVGLGHVKTKAALMYPRVSLDVDRLRGPRPARPHRARPGPLPARCLIRPAARPSRNGEARRRAPS